MTVKDFRNIILLIIVSIFITIVVPGVISALNGTFYYDDLKKKVSVDKIAKINAIDAEGKELDEQLKLVNVRIRNFALGKTDSSGLSVSRCLCTCFTNGLYGLETLC